MRQFIEIKTDSVASRELIKSESGIGLVIKLENWPSYLVMQTVPTTVSQQDNTLTATLRLDEYGFRSPPLSILGKGTTCRLIILNKPRLELTNVLVTKRWFEPANQQSWKVIPIPESHKTPLDYNRTFTKQEFERIKLGDTPLSMDDHWFAFYENACLYIHRSWTGLGVFEIYFSDCAITQIWRDAITFPEFESVDGLLNGLCSEAMLFQ